MTRTPEEQAAWDKHEADMAKWRSRPIKPIEPTHPIDPGAAQALHDALVRVEGIQEQRSEKQLIDQIKSDPELQTIARLRDPLRPTDLGNSERFATQNHTRSKFSASSWFVWDGRRMKRDDTEAVRRLAKSTVKTMYGEAAELEDKEDRMRMSKWAKSSESSKVISAMLREAQSDIRIAMTIDRFDSPKTKYLFNCMNGTVDLKTSDLLPHNPNDYITRLAPVSLDFSVDTSGWIRFLEEIIPSSPIRAFLQRYIGYSLTGDTSEQKFVVMHGTGANGKSTFISAILAMMGEYATQASFDTFLVQEKAKAAGSSRPDIMALRGVRFVSAVEAGRARRLDEEIIKGLTGGDTISSRANYEAQTTFTPECKLAMVSNNRPEIWGNDLAIWRRVLEVPFEVTIPESDRDPHLLSTLTSTTGLNAIFAWAVLGCLDWVEQGLNPPSEVLAATETYKAEENILGPFLETCVYKEVGSVATFKDVFKSYHDFMHGERVSIEEKQTILSRKAFSRLMNSIGYPTSTQGHAKEIVFKDLKLKMKSL